MSKRIVVRLPNELVDFVDDLVDSGAARNRVMVVTRALERERRRALAERDARILARIGPDPEFAVTDVEPLEGLWIRATFSDGAIKEIDLSELIGKGSVFAPIRDRREIFEQVRVNPESHTVEWPGEVDLDPDVLYGRFEPASGARLKRRTIRGPIRAAG
jgi:Arc/MetJ-type ribon-helix-helix transcriptional regulator